MTTATGKNANPKRPKGAATADDDGTLADRYRRVKERIRAAAERGGHPADRIVLLAVTKYAAIDQIRQLIECGQQDFAENRVQQLQKRIAVVNEFLARHRELSGAKTVNIPDTIRWHMIGHLQRNKVRKVIGVVRLIHSVDSLRLVEEIHSCATKLDDPVEILVQTNITGEGQKCGVAPAAVLHLIEQIDSMIGLRPRGLMCMAPLADDPEKVRPIFERGRELFEDIRSCGAGGDRFDILSMGMSHDFEVAIECGANLIRIGSAIFGEPQVTEDDGSEDDA